MNDCKESLKNDLDLAKQTLYLLGKLNDSNEIFEFEKYRAFLKQVCERVICLDKAKKRDAQLALRC